MTFDPAALDRYITGNWGEDQFSDDWLCPGHVTTYLGEDQGEQVWQCRNCGDIFPTDQKENDGKPEST